MSDLQSITSDIKLVLSDLKVKIQGVADQLLDVEQKATHHDAKMHSLQELASRVSPHLTEMRCRLKDLDNRGSCQNLKIC